MSSIEERVLRREQEKFDYLIKKQSQLYEKSLADGVRRRLMVLHSRYRIKFGKEYKGGVNNSK